ncbi:MAG: LysM peptidoglycan-binding domain-containing protein [Marinilabiliales bacterium]|nr:LysM peptidoglycan-binding domain-containing protein [Marinilabiliales bacterium]
MKGKTALTYVVKDGDNLGYISEWYDVGLSDLRYWNNIYRNTIRIGQKLTVYVDPAKAGQVQQDQFNELHRKAEDGGEGYRSSHRSLSDTCRKHICLLIVRR